MMPIQLSSLAQTDEATDDIQPTNDSVDPMTVESEIAGEPAPAGQLNESLLDELNTLRHDVAALVNTQKRMIEMMQTQSSCIRRVYVDKPDNLTSKSAIISRHSWNSFRFLFKHY